MLGSVGRATDETDKNPYFQETYILACVWVGGDEDSEQGDE